MTRHYLVGDVAYPEANLVAVEQGKPVVVIDPDGREQVERLVQGVLDEARGYRIDRAILDVGLSKTLRELANPKPPKPDEPTGLGAVVEDAEGRRWTRADHGFCGWARAGEWKSWETLDAVRVVREGVDA